MSTRLDEEFTQLLNEEEAVNKAVSDFTATLLHSATITHMMHLTTRSYAEHMALATYYTGVPALVDAVVESYQGKYGNLINHNGVNYASETESPVEYMQRIKSFVDSVRKRMPQDSELQNDIELS